MSRFLLPRRELLERTEQYDVVESYVRARHIKRDYVQCADCDSPTAAEMPPMPCERSLFTCRFVAWLVVMTKFVLLVPLDRIRRLLHTQGVDLPREPWSTSSTRRPSSQARSTASTGRSSAPGRGSHSTRRA